VPVLILDDGTSLYDSSVIAEYVDSLASPAWLPAAPLPRALARRSEALADGICDAAAAIVVERRRPAVLQSEEWIDRQRRKIREGTAELARELDERAWCHGETYSLADIATGCALGYLDLRHAELDWRALHPNLARLAEKLAKRPPFADTLPPT